MKRKSEIVLFEDSSKASFGGGQQVSIELLKSLIQEDYETILIDFSNQTLFVKKAQTLVNKMYFLKVSNRFKKTISYKNSFSFSKIEILFNLILLPLNLIKLIKIAKYRPRSIWICTTKRSIIYGFILSAFQRKIKFITYYHNVFPEKSKWLRIFKFISRQSELNIFVSETAKNSLKVPNSLVIYNPVNFDNNIELEIKKKSKNSKFIIGTLSSLYGYKGIEQVIKAFKSKALKESDKFQLKIFGDGPTRPILEELADNQENIRFMGFENDKKKVFESIDVLSVPSLDSESFSMVAFEAIQYNTPVILSNNGAHLEFFNPNTCIFIDPNSPLSIINAIISYQENYNELCKAQSIALNKSFKQKFSISYSKCLTNALKNIK